MKTSSIAAVVGIALVGATAAWAQSAPDAPKGPPHKPGEHGRMMHDPQRAQQRAKEFCVDRYAHAVGRMAYLEAKLDLNATQKPLYEKWSQTVLSGAAKDRDACAARVADFKPGAAKPSILDRETRLEQMMTAKLETMKAQRPSLEALYASLTPDQQAQFNKPFGGHGFGGHGGHRGHGFGDRRGPDFGPGGPGGGPGGGPRPDRT